MVMLCATACELEFGSGNPFETFANVERRCECLMLMLTTFARDARETY